MSTEQAERSSIEVQDSRDASRYEARLDGVLAGFLDYRRVGSNRIVLLHTEVDKKYEGGGVGTRLARFALDDARARGLGVIPKCPFVAAFLRRHPDYADLVVGSSAPRCGHLGQIRDVTPSAQGCEECLKIGAAWVHLRLCLTCGRVGCCDSSPNRHASGHAAGSGHPLVRSFEPGEDWMWCYVDEAMLEPA